VACWRTKAAVSLKCVKIEEKLLWRAYRKSPTLFRTVPFLTPYGLPFPKIGVHNSTPKLQSLLSQERLKLRTANFADTFIGSIRTQTHKQFWRKRSVGVSRDCPIFFRAPPIISGTDKATNFKFGRYIHRVHANKTPLKFWEKMERGRIQGLPKFLKYPLLSQEWVKVRKSNLADIFRGSIRTKAIKNSGENGAWAYAGTAQIF